MSRHRILRRVREALAKRDAVAHPGSFESWTRPAAGGPEEVRAGGGPSDSTGSGDDAAPRASTPVDRFEAAFRAAGGEVERVADAEEARAKVRALAEGFPGASLGAGIPHDLLPDTPRLAPVDAPLGVSMARGAVAETGSLLMDARDGRRAQLLPPVHVVLVSGASVHATLRDALLALRHDLPSGLGLHSGPSKSADIGQILVEGVHGPGRVVAVVVEDPDGAEGARPAGAARLPER